MPLLALVTQDTTELQPSNLLGSACYTITITTLQHQRLLAPWSQITKAKVQPNPHWADLHIPRIDRPLPYVKDAEWMCVQGDFQLPHFSSPHQSQIPAPLPQSKGSLQESKG